MSVVTAASVRIRMRCGALGGKSINQSAPAVRSARATGQLGG
jgi:hypothetical protein